MEAEPATPVTINHLGATGASGAGSVYDIGNHRIFGVAQAESSDRTLSFTSQDGLACKGAV